MAILKIKDENGKIIEIPVLKGDKGDPGESATLDTITIEEINNLFIEEEQ